MNNVLVNNKPRPTTPGQLVIGYTNSIANVFGFSLWQNKKLQAEVSSVQRQYDEAVRLYEKKVAAWDELVSYTHAVYVDTNILLEQHHRDHVFGICLQNNWTVIVTKFVYAELNNQANYAGEDEDSLKKKEKAAKALEAINVTGVMVTKPAEGEEVFKVLRKKYKNKAGSELMDCAIAEHLTEQVKLGNKLFFVSNDGDFGSYTRFEAEKVGKPENYQHFNLRGFNKFNQAIKAKQELLK